MPEDKNKEPQVQEVVINDELINNKLNILAGMVDAISDKIDKLSKKI